jgi:glutamate dehydrogenase
MLAPQRARPKTKVKSATKTKPPVAANVPKAPKDFVRQFYQYTAAQDLALLTKGEGQAIASAMWHLLQRRKRGEIKLALYNPSREQHGFSVDHTVLDVVTDDMPFLVDSVTSELQRRGLTIHFAVHPVVFVQRNAQGQLQELRRDPGQPDEAESVMHFQFDRTLEPETLKDLELTLQSVLREVESAVQDWDKMRARNHQVSTELERAAAKPATADFVAKARDFLTWLDDNNFTYLGYRQLYLTKAEGQPIWKVVKNSGLGILRDEEVRLFGGLREFGTQHRDIRSFLEKRRVIVVTKTNIRARVHRPVPMDAIFVQRFDDQDNVIGEELFVGLFTSASYAQTPREVPFIRHKIRRILDRAGFDPAGHDGKALVHILDTYPRDELFQISTDDLYNHAMGILQLRERARTALFTRQDPFKRFVTNLVFIPRDRYDSDLRRRIQQHLEAAFQGSSVDFQTRIDDSPLARLFLTIATKPDTALPDQQKLESELQELCRGWSDLLHEALVQRHGEFNGLKLFRRYEHAFSPSYRDAIPAAAAVFDIARLDEAGSQGRLKVDFYRDLATGSLHLKLYNPAAPLLLSDILPMIENMGLKIEYMGGPYEITIGGAPTPTIYLHEFVGQAAYAPQGEFTTIKPLFEEALTQVAQGLVDNDLFNALTLRAGLTIRDITVLQAMARYLKQLRAPYAQETMAQALLANPTVAQALAQLFTVRHDPALTGDRRKQLAAATQTVIDQLQNVTSIEQDRILRRFLNLIQSSLRTNCFLGKDYLSIKYDSRAVDYMPLPKPYAEIFVYSPRTEAVHLRGGKVARGGIRWSDRREDFRHEVLGLMKAQMVKNSVIVPVGSKGGFILKRPPLNPADMQAEGIACYRIMMQGLLDITDNLKNGKVVPPTNVVQHDGDDPYLVVAADKGTAKFSDIANGIAQDYGFWLDDAFASGGSAGYDHKGMGITARGAWEAIKRHFRELGTDIQTTDFTVVGVGDMSGDVFGNAMLLSQHIRLLGAFDHRHIFCDPNPDAARSFQERQRLFALPTSSWADYDAKKLSKGGAIYSRADKQLKLTPEIRQAFGITAETLSPSELILAMLRARVDLLYFGGIGTYVKASDEAHEDAGDRSNDAQRIDGRDINAKVVGEGANLACTQRARIEYAQQGGRINTDAIDNSAGVDTSDHEVNIKILLRAIMAQGELALPARNKLLATMTDDVGQLVLRDNYLQTQALSLAEAQAAELLPAHGRAIRALEKSGLLNRAIEFLPDDAEIQDRQRIKKGLTRPELAVLLSYAKIWLYEQILASDLPDENYLAGDLSSYFPPQLAKKYPAAIAKHQLGREIIATALTNSLVNRAGSHFIPLMMERSGATAIAVTRAYLLARESFTLRGIWREVEALDNKVPAATQTQMLLLVNELLSSAVAWFLQNEPPTARLADSIDQTRAGLAMLQVWLEKNPKLTNGRTAQRETDLVAQGVPVKLARRLSLLPQLGSALDILSLARTSKRPIDQVAEVFFTLGQRLDLDWLAERSQSMMAETPWQREALINFFSDILAAQQQLSGKILSRLSKDKKDMSVAAALDGWASRNRERLTRYEAMLDEIQSIGSLDIAMLSLVSRQLAGLVG